MPLTHQPVAARRNPLPLGEERVQAREVGIGDSILTAADEYSLAVECRHLLQQLPAAVSGMLCVGFRAEYDGLGFPPVTMQMQNPVRRPLA